ncbi:MAG: tRNA-modifying protein YgfZ [Candidatus Erwinia impunctatus]|nr:tRNA-modifying protein YgfZ [Culicoides impunctatus]
MITFPFAAQLPLPATELPLSLISLEDWALTTVSGADSISYLQGQLTLDVAALQPHEHKLAAHCDAKGKMWSTLRLFHRSGPQLAYITRRSVQAVQITELKKYAVFSEVAISADEHMVLLGVAGSGCRAALATHFSHLPDAQSPAVQEGDASLLWFGQPAERFLLALPPGQAAELCQQLAGTAQQTDSQQWLALDIEAGLPVIDSATSAQFIPQATNLQALDAISFKKGCYSGQEMVARAKFRGANKRALFWLAGKADLLTEINSGLELKLGDNWRRTGTVLAACRMRNQQLWIQAVLNNDLPAESEFHVPGEVTSQLSLQPLPYLLE